MSESRGSGFDARCLLTYSFFFNLVEKNSFTVKKISKCRENGIDRLRNGNLPRRCATAGDAVNKTRGQTSKGVSDG